MSGKFKAMITALVAVIVLGVSIFVITTILNSTKNVTVYDFRIMEMGANETGVELADKTVYLTTKNDNKFEFEIKKEATDSNVNVRFGSSDETIAKAYQESGKFYCEYFRAGKVIITAYVGDTIEIKDEFSLLVKENVIDSLKFEGDFVSEDGLTLTVFNDSREYSFKYTATGYNGDKFINYDSLEVDLNEAEKIKGNGGINGATIELDKNEHILKIKIPDGYMGDSFVEYLNFNIFYMSTDGKVLIKTIPVEIKVEKKAKLGLIAVVSNNPYFETEKYVYTNIENKNTIKLNEGEEIIEVIYVNDAHNDIYIKLYILFNNGDRQIVTEINNSLGISIKNGNYYKIEGAGDKVFEGITITLENLDSSKLYTYNEETKIYKYNYWDNRFERQDVICDSNGNITGFEGESSGE